MEIVFNFFGLLFFLKRRIWLKDLKAYNFAVVLRGVLDRCNLPLTYQSHEMMKRNFDMKKILPCDPRINSAASLDKVNHYMAGTFRQMENWGSFFVNWSNQHYTQFRLIEKSSSFSFFFSTILRSRWDESSPIIGKQTRILSVFKLLSRIMFNKRHKFYPKMLREPRRKWKQLYWTFW